MAFGVRNLGLSNLDGRVMEATSALRLTGCRHRLSRNIRWGETESGSGILAMQPEIVPLDEPTSQLDPWRGDIGPCSGG